MGPFQRNFIILSWVSAAYPAAAFAPQAGFVSPSLAVTPRHRPSVMARQSTAAPSSGVTDPAIAALVADAAAATYVPAPLAVRAGAWAVAAAAVAAVGSPEVLPAELRALVASLGVFTFFEYCFHRWVMHAQDGTLEQTLFGAYQTLHITHHCETKRDMTLEDAGDSDPRHIYFSAATTAASVAISTAGLAALDRGFGLGLAEGHLGAAALPLVSGAVAALHTSIWQTLHGDIHEYLSPNVPGALNRFDPLSADTPYTRWMVSNHVGHHVVRGQGNYNIVFPGPDYLLGTGFVPE